MIAALNQLPVNVTSDRSPAGRSTIATFTLGSVEADEDLVKTARDNGVFIGRRKFGIRAGYHFWNNAKDRERLLDVVETVSRATTGSGR